MKNSKIHPLILATKLHKGAQRKDNNKDYLMKSFWEVSEGAGSPDLLDEF